MKAPVKKRAPRPAVAFTPPKVPAKAKKPPKPFDRLGFLAMAEAIRSLPPCKDYIERGEPKGTMVARFALPLELCKPFNILGRKGNAAAHWALGQMKAKCFAYIRAQNNGRVEAVPLPGRPHVVCIRFSSVEADGHGGWEKNPVDRLRAKHNGIGLIVDDGPRHIKLHSWWEKCPPGKGGVILEVWTGETNQ